MRTYLVIAALLIAVPAAARDLSVPDPVLTPGALNPAVTQKTIGSTICVPGWTKTVRPPVSYTNKIKRALMAKAGIPWSRRSNYELDHAYALTIGGDPRSPLNLWLQKWIGPHGARAKDKLEVALKTRVCRGKLTLEQARALIMPDWLAGYRTIFGPLGQS